MRPREPRLDFERLYRSHRQEVYRVALRKLGDHHEAEDVTQTTFLDAYRAVLRGTEPDLPRAWLHAIAENVRRRRFRTTRHRPREEPLRETLLAEDAVAFSADEIRAALATLAASQRKAFVLRELGGMSYGEIATELGTTVAAVQMLLFRARHKLRRELEGPTLGRLGGLVPVPHWLASLADRLIPAASGPARVVGLAAAGAIAVGGGITTDASPSAPGRAPAAERAAPAANTQPPQVRAAAPQTRSVVAASSRSPLLTVKAVAARSEVQASGRAAPGRGSEPVAPAAPDAGPAPTAPAAVPVATPVPGTQPAAPVAPPATAAEDDGSQAARPRARAHTPGDRTRGAGRSAGPSTAARAAGGGSRPCASRSAGRREPPVTPAAPCASGWRRNHDPHASGPDSTASSVSAYDLRPA